LSKTWSHQRRKKKEEEEGEEEEEGCKNNKIIAENSPNLQKRPIQV
jgi:hypothetical protein